MDRPESTSFEFRSHTVSPNPHRAGASTSEHTAIPRGKQTRFVSIEALAWLCIAQRNDLEMNDDFLFCPPEARGRHEPLEVEDFFEGLDLALDGAQG